MRAIKKTDVVGARIVDIHETSEPSEGLDNRVIYFTVDRGFTFITPFAGQPWYTVEVPTEAARLEDVIVQPVFAVKKGWSGRMRFKPLPPETSDIVRQIKQKVVAGVYCGPFDQTLDFYHPDDGTIVFEDGSQASNNMVAPQGTGGAGLCFRTDSLHCTPLDQMVDYFSIPVGKKPRP